MKELQRKQKIRRVIYSIPALIVLLILTFFLARGALRVLEKEQESRANSKDIGEKVTTLSLREQELKGDITRLKTEEGIKDEIRERFSVTQEGEYVAVIVDDKRSSSSTDLSALPWYKRFWFAIMGSK
jgi:cell division protein FtsB